VLDICEVDILSTRTSLQKKSYVSRPITPLHEQHLHTSACALKQLSQVAVVGLDIAHKPVWNTAVAVARKSSVGTKHSHKKALIKRHK
jgi:hypothetical protein